MSIYYNPSTRNPERKRLVEDIREIPKGSPGYHMHLYAAYPSREAMMAKDLTGTLSWFEGDTLYIGRCTGTWDYIPLGDAVVNELTYEGGQAYCLTEGIAQEWLQRSSVKDPQLKYFEEYDVYVVFYKHAPTV